MGSDRKVPIRSCVSCRVPSEKKRLLRIVRTPDGQVLIDRTGKLPGRGAYLCGAKECTKLAIKKNKLGRALRCEIPDNIKAELENICGVEEVTMATGNRQMTVK